MATIVKLMSQTGFIYEKNNFVALVEKEGAHEDYHKMMDFIKKCKLGYAMLEAPIIYCEVVEEIWTTAVFNQTDLTITIDLKVKAIVLILMMCKHVLNCLKTPP